MKLAKDLMTTSPLCFAQSHHVTNLVDIVLEKKIFSVPIVDANKRLLGVFTDFEITRVFITHHYNEKIQRDKDIIGNYIKHMIKAPTVYEDESVAEIVKELTASPIHRVFVVNRKNEQLVGVISPLDVLRFLRGENDDTEKMMEILFASKEEVKHLKAKVSKLEDKVEHFSEVFDSSPYMMHSLDASGKIVMANKTLHEVLGYNNGELIGKTFADLYPNNQISYAEKGLQSIIKGEVFSNKLSGFVKKDDTIVYVDIASSPVKSDKGEFISTISVSRVVPAGRLQSALSDEKYIDL